MSTTNTGRSKALLAGLVVVGLVDLAFINLHAAPRYLAERDTAGSGSDANAATTASTAEPVTPPPVRTAAEPSAEPVAAAATDTPSTAEPTGEGGAAPTAEPTAVAAVDDPPEEPAQPAASGKRPHIPALGFSSGSIELGQRSKGLLFKVAKYMRAVGGQSVMLQGHADERGSEAVNQALSLQRARAAAAYLIELGVSKERMQITGVGEQMPVDRGNSAASLARNRRVIVIWQ